MRSIHVDIRNCMYGYIRTIHIVRQVPINVHQQEISCFLSLSFLMFFCLSISFLHPEKERRKESKDRSVLIHQAPA